MLSSNPVERMRAKRRHRSTVVRPTLNREFSFAEKANKTQLFQRLKTLFQSRLTYAFKSLVYSTQYTNNSRHEMSQSMLVIPNLKLREIILTQLKDILQRRALGMGWSQLKRCRKRKSIKLKRSIDDRGWFSQYDSKSRSVPPFCRNAQIETIMMPSTNMPLSIVKQNILNSSMEQSVVNRKSLLQNDKISRYKALNKQECGVVKKEVVTAWMLSGFIDSVQVSRSGSVSGIHRSFR